jgi:tripartite-type tricarboxylate transporter receptor subunit TctC
VSARLTRAEFIGFAAALALASQARAAQTVADFYRGRTVSLIVPTAKGGINDLSARLVAKHLGRFIPGAPAVAAINRPEGGGLKLANDFADGAPKDGSVIAVVQRGVPQLAIQGDRSARFDPLKLNWLGSLSSFATDAYVLIVASRHPAQTWRDLAPPAPPATIGGDAPGSTNLTFALVARDAMHLNIEVKDGYSGAAGMFFAMMDGDLDGQIIGLNSLMANQPELWHTKDVRPLIQFGRMRRHPLLPDVPLATEIATDAPVRAILAFTKAPLKMALPFCAPAGIPAERAAALQTAFMSMVRDREFLADAKRAKLDITPVSSDEVRRVISAMAATPRDVIARYNAITGAVL